MHDHGTGTIQIAGRSRVDLDERLILRLPLPLLLHFYERLTATPLLLHYYERLPAASQPR